MSILRTLYYPLLWYTEGMKNGQHIIICPVGLNGSGKGKVCSILEKQHGFVNLSTSNVFRSLTTERGLDLTRENIGKIANELRAEHGKDFSTQFLSKSMDLSAHSYVVDGCRQVEEIQYLQKAFPQAVVVVKIYCDPKIRFERMKARNRVGDPATFAEFLEADEIELGNKMAINAMNYRACFELARYQIDNNGSLEDLERNVEEFLSQLGY